MTTWPNMTDPQFLDANGVGGLNAAFGAISGAVVSIGSGAWAAPGLIAPESMTVSFSGMVATIGLPKPWGVVASSGAIVKAHGTQTNQDTQTYTVNFASLVPASGSVTAFLAATIAQIQQNPFPIPGPPPGDPAYNPNYVPTVGYATNLYSVALAAVSGGIDNVNAFELLRTTLSAGQVAVTGWSLIGQVRAADRKAWPGTVLASGGVLAPQQAQTVISPTVPGLTFTLPLAATANGLMFGFVNATSGSCTVVTSGADSVFGFSTATGSVTIPSSGAMLLWGNGAASGYQVLAASPNMVRSPRGLQSYGAGSFSFTVPADVYFIRPSGWAGGGGGGGVGGSVSASSYSGGGGGGGYSDGGWIAVVPGQVITGTVGAGGSAGQGTPSNGGAGGQTTITVGATTLTMNGGTGGQSGSGGSGGGGVSGGTASGGVINKSGDPGGAFVAAGGGEGGGAFQSPGPGPGGEGATGQSGGFPGAGGAGTSAPPAGSFMGGTGAAGQVILEW